MFKYNDHISKEHTAVTKPLIYYCKDCPNNFNDVKAFCDHQKTHALEQKISQKKIQKKPQKDSEAVKQTQFDERKFKCEVENCHELFYTEVVRNIHRSKVC
jgi:hypothetical protein